MAGADAISIHALREEGDKSLSPPPPLPNNFYPRPPRGGRHRPKALWRRLLYFYPRPPRGGRRHSTSYKQIPPAISIHALREEGDTGIRHYVTSADGFLSTPSARRATAGAVYSATTTAYFYPRPPRGGRPSFRSRGSSWRVFLSTPSARRATALPAALRNHLVISIHALREEGDVTTINYPRIIVKFLSTPSARRATYHTLGGNGTGTISIHALREEGDVGPRCSPRRRPISIHALREEGDEVHEAMDKYIDEFLSTPSARRATYKIKLKEYREVNFYPRPPRGGRRGAPAD